MTVVNLSFAGAGFLGAYHLGVTEALLRHGHKLLSSLKACAGASAGSLVATVIITAPDKIQVKLFIYNQEHVKTVFWSTKVNYVKCVKKLSAIVNLKMLSICLYYNTFRYLHLGNTYIHSFFSFFLFLGILF